MEERLPLSKDRSTSTGRGVFDALEAQLEKVVERDGIIMQSALGPRKRARRPSVISMAKTDISQHVSVPIPDQLAELDAQLVAFALGHSQERAHDVAIKREPHASSQYVVSLHRVLMTDDSAFEDERVPVEDALQQEAAEPIGLPVDVYATVTKDLTTEAGLSHQRAFVEQFTPADFDEAYRERHGVLSRINHRIGSLQTSFVNMFRRTRRAEQHLVEEVVEMEQAAGIPVAGLLRLSFARALASFAALAFVVTLPAQAVALYRAASSHGDQVVEEGQAAVQELKALPQTDGTASSLDALRNASSKFREADTLLSQAGAWAVGAASVMPKQYRSARALLEIGDKASEAARLLGLGYEKVYADPSRRLDERFDVLGAYTRSALLLLADARKAAATVDVESVPAAQRDSVKALLPQLEKSTQALQEVSALADVLSTMVGKEGLRKYLLVFQNPTELRPTGGFMGSLAEVTFDKGNLRDITVPHGGTYDLKGQLTARLSAPKPLQLINAQWQFQDANWFPDFPKSADKIRWFWSKAGQPTIDGVIAVNATFVEDVLRITGPVDMPEYGKVIDASNFMLETQKAVELEYDKENNTPKKFIGDLAEKLRERLKLLDKQEWLALATAVSHALETKDIQVALFHPEEEALAERYGWSGRMKPTTGDALALIETNIAGQKTDASIREQVKHDVRIADDGRIEDTVVLKREHTAGKGELFRGVRNVSYLRVYVPKGSILLSAEGFRPPNAGLFKKPEDIDQEDPDIAAIARGAKTVGDVEVSQEGDRTVFGGWMQIDPGETQEIRLTYRLPFVAQELLSRLDASVPPSDKPRAAYLLLLTSQSGKASRTIETHVTYPASWNVSWTNKPEGLSYQGVWDRDMVLAGLFSTGL